MAFAVALFAALSTSSAFAQCRGGSEQLFQPAFQHIVDDNRQYLAERRALRAAKVEQARQRLASRKEKPTKHRVVTVNMPR